MALPTLAPETVTVLGIDDFSFKRGRKFGTILVDLVRHTVIDLLAERSSQSAAGWMRKHPEIAYVSRDRGKDYAQGASEGAPQAIQVSDRFHLMKNFVEAVEAEVARCYKQHRQKRPPLPSPDLPAPEEWRQAPDADAERKRMARLADKEQQYAQVKDLLACGLSAKEIAQQLDIPVRRVYRWRECERCPAHQSPRLLRDFQTRAIRADPSITEVGPVTKRDCAAAWDRGSDGAAMAKVRTGSGECASEHSAKYL